MSETFECAPAEAALAMRQPIAYSPATSPALPARPRRVTSADEHGMLPGTNQRIEAEALHALHALQVTEARRRPARHPQALLALFPDSPDFG